MLKALRTVQRSYVRAPLKSFVLSQRQQTEKPTSKPVADRHTAMQHKTKIGGNNVG